MGEGEDGRGRGGLPAEWLQVAQSSVGVCVGFLSPFLQDRRWSERSLNFQGTSRLLDKTQGSFLWAQGNSRSPRLPPESL